jgi:hypothetical protein
VLLAIVGIVAAVSFVSGGGLKELGVPADFPRYPHSTLTGTNSFVGAGVGTYPTGKQVRATFEIPDTSDRVASFYEANLDQGPWQVVSVDKTCGCMSFKRRSGNQTGRLQVLGHGSTTRIDLELRSPA